ncbi:glycosyltransferase family 4 protein [Paenibacillus sp. LC231]|uniref:glycosyltransferase family 4 protein n=1 Tax=unclassified Paenibacillus TaxID=185978 RepID=UPI00139230B7|nr:glycosyltransferase family 4 protein [Paenibacillus sp. LC231]
MRILMMTPDYPPNLYGGIGTHVYNLATGFVNEGNSVTVLVAKINRHSDDPNNFEVSENGKLTVINFPTTMDGDFSNEIDPHFSKTRIATPFKWAELSNKLFPMVYRFLKSVDPFDVFHAHDSFHAFTSVAIKDLFNIPMVTTIHSISAPPNHFNDSLRRYMLNNSNKAIVVSKWLNEEIGTRYGELATDVHVIPNGIDYDSCEDSFRRACNPQFQPLSITFCGRLSPLKGCDVLLKAFAILKRSNSSFNYKLKIAGDGPLKNELKLLSESLSIDKDVEFLGFLKNNEVKLLLRQSSLHVIPSIEESFGITALEAIAEGIPVIASQTGGLSEIIENGVNGIVFPLGNSEILANEMDKLLNNPYTRSQLAKQALKRIEKYSWDNIVIETNNIYNMIIND